MMRSANSRWVLASSSSFALESLLRADEAVVDLGSLLGAGRALVRDDLVGHVLRGDALTEDRVDLGELLLRARVAVVEGERLEDLLLRALGVTLVEVALRLVEERVDVRRVPLAARVAVVLHGRRHRTTLAFAHGLRRVRRLGLLVGVVVVGRAGLREGEGE